MCVRLSMVPLISVLLVTCVQAQDKGAGMVRWELTRDYKIDGKLEDDQRIRESPLQLRIQDAQITGRFLDKKADGADNDSVFTGEIARREKPLVILRQESKTVGGIYVVIHTGHLVGPDHYRGTWHDNSGQAGDFELKQRR